jgi:hypothetical protein
MSNHAKSNHQPKSGTTDQSTPTRKAENSIDPTDLRRAISEPGLQTLSPEVVLALQQSHGNQFVQRLIDQAQQPATGDKNTTPPIQQTSAPGSVQRMMYDQVESYVSTAYMLKEIDPLLQDAIIKKIVEITEKWQREGIYFDRQNVVDNILGTISNNMLDSKGPDLKSVQDWADLIGEKIKEAELEATKEKPINAHLTAIERGKWAKPWGAATGAKVKTSGHGGVVFVYFGTHNPIIVKGGKPIEALGADLAQEVGLRAPKTRVVDTGSLEEKTIDSIQVEYKVTVPNGKPYLVVDFVSGTELSDLEPSSLSAKQAHSLVASLGQWMAFDILISESDRFSMLTGTFDSINSANFFLNPSDHELHITGIDQSVLKGDTLNGEKVLKMLTSLSPDISFVERVGGMVHKYVGKVSDTSVESLGKAFIEAAQRQIRVIGKNLDEVVVKKKALALGLGEEDVVGLLNRLKRYKI